MAESLVKTTSRCCKDGLQGGNRWTHSVNYKQFKLNNKLIKNLELILKKVLINYLA